MTDESAIIVPLEAQDIDELGRLARVIWLAHYSSIIGLGQIDYMLAQRYSPEVIREELQRSDLWWDKLLVDGVMCGFASYFLAEPGTMKLDKVYVHQAHQRRGYGGLLIQRALEAAARAGCSRLILAVNKNNRQAIEAYFKHGFTIGDSVVKDIGGGFVMDDYIMVKEVAGNV
jgi:GNAT superfamily N-acetyltransferase